MSAYRMTDSEVDPIIKNAQTIEKTTDPASNPGLAGRLRLNPGRPEIGHFRCRTYGTAVPSSAGGGGNAQVPVGPSRRPSASIFANEHSYNGVCLARERTGVERSAQGSALEGTVSSPCLPKRDFGVTHRSSRVAGTHNGTVRNLRSVLGRLIWGFRA